MTVEQLIGELRKLPPQISIEIIVSDGEPPESINTIDYDPNSSRAYIGV